MNFEAIFKEAHEAGMAAGIACVPVAMVVGYPRTPFGSGVDRSKPHEVVPDGVCGFAWVHFPGNTPWARWAKQAGHTRPGYPKGLDISCHEFNQSMTRKENYCHAFVQVLSKHGISAYTGSRMD